MTHWHTYISKGKRPVLALLLSAGLSLGGIASAQGQSLQKGQEDPGFAVALQDGYGLQQYGVVSDSSLDGVRGQGSTSPTPAIPTQFGIILWDEGDVRKGSRNKSSHGNATMTVQVRMEGR
ncbi:MAG: hypothetical protein OIF55_17885 [Amphritea sp.]|nr:hypothetical protein [Amphritea sp.]